VGVYWQVKTKKEKERQKDKHIKENRTYSFQSAIGTMTSKVNATHRKHT